MRCPPAALQHDPSTPNLSVNLSVSSSHGVRVWLPEALCISLPGPVLLEAQLGRAAERPSSQRASGERSHTEGSDGSLLRRSSV